MFTKGCINRTAVAWIGYLKKSKTNKNNKLSLLVTFFLLLSISTYSIAHRYFAFHIYIGYLQYCIVLNKFHFNFSSFLLNKFYVDITYITHDVFTIFIKLQHSLTPCFSTNFNTFIILILLLQILRGNSSDACEIRDPCQHGGICISTDSGPICECRNPDYEGEYCEKGK